MYRSYVTIISENYRKCPMRVVSQTILFSAKYRILRPQGSKLNPIGGSECPRLSTGVGNDLRCLHILSLVLAYPMLLSNVFWQSGTFYPYQAARTSFWHYLQYFRLSPRLFYQRPGKNVYSPWVNQDSGREC